MAAAQVDLAYSPAVTVSWPAPPPELLPPSGTVIVLHLSLTVPPERLRELRGLLSADEIAKADRYFTAELRAHSAAARGQLREILGAALGRDPAALRFRVGPSGKPALEAGELQFNLSHSADEALVALSQKDIGVDLEVHKPRSFDDVARRFFAGGEQARLFALPAAARPREFFRLWTAKEAFLKCTGDGITVPLGDFEARFDGQGGGHVEVLRGAAFGRRFWLRELPLPEGATGAICGEGPPLAALLASWRRTS